MKKKRILFLSYDGLTDQLGQSQIIPYLSGLVKKGFTITIISCEKNDPFIRNGNEIKLILENANIFWNPLIYHKSPSVFSTIYDVSQMKKAAIRLHQIQPFDIVHCRSYITALVGLHFKRKKNIPFIFDMRGFWADERIEGKIWSLKNPVHRIVYKYFKKKEKEFLNESDAIVSLTDSAKKTILTWNLPQVDSNKIHVIPCCADLGLFNFENTSPERLNTLRTETSIPEDSYSISYLGAIGTWYMLEEMLRFYARLRNKYVSSKFLIITGEKPDLIFNTANKLNISTDGIIIRKAERTDVPIYLSLCSFSVFFIKPVFSKTASSPTKLGEILGMGIPVICNSGIGDVDSQIRNSNAGIVVDDFSTESFDQVINQLTTLIKSDRNIIRKIAIENYSLEGGIVKYEEIYILASVFTTTASL